MVKWKDALTGVWHGPDPMLTWTRGSVCVFPQEQQDPVWVPECLVRRIHCQEEHVCADNDQPIGATDDSARNDAPEMGDPISFSEANASQS